MLPNLVASGRWLSFFVLACAACASNDPPIAPSPPTAPPYVPPPEHCEPPDLDNLHNFVACNTGSGVFGTWVSDDFGLIAYDYGLDQNVDDRASFFNTEQLDRRDHWHAFGNARINALFFNDGYIEVTTQDRGETYLNKFDESQHNFAGGFSYIDDGAEVFSTAYKWRPKGSHTSRRFGMGYAEATMDHRELRIIRHSFAPPGDLPLLVDEVTLHNLSGEPKSLRHYEFWDVGRRPIEIQWIVSGIPFSSTPADVRKFRDERNGLFDESVTWDPDAKLLGIRRAHAAGVAPPSPDAPHETDYYPADPFLVALSANVSDIYAEQDDFFGQGGVAAPTAIANRSPGHGLTATTLGAPASGLGQSRMFVMRSDVTLAPGEQKTLRFAYGYAPFGQPWPVDTTLRDPQRDLFGEQAQSQRDHLMLFAADRDPVVHREVAWHTSQIEASVGFRTYWNSPVIPQGSTYLYLHGADGAARDLGLFAIPLVYTHPALARAELALNMMITHAADRRISYAFQGHGMLDDALGIHHQPSDLTLFLLWALSEYIGATGDVAFLDASMPFYPLEAEPNTTVWDHLHDAVRHLFDTVGTGDHGLIRVGTGDWSDGIVFEAPDRDLAVTKGESVPNTQMAVAILPRVADLIEPRDPALATEIRGRIPAFRDAVRATWTGDFFGRAYFGDGKLAYSNTINLESQVWALIGNGMFPSPADRERLLKAIQSQLDWPSWAGATLVPSGQVWPAISALYTWGASRTAPHQAWAHFTRNTMATHAVAYPEIWYGIWSGPDGLNGPASDRPGESWFSQVTPMVDFPIMNNNQHAMPLFAALRLAGIDATATGIRIAPRMPGRHFSLQTQLITLSQRDAALTGSYRPLGGGTRTIEVAAPLGASIQSARLNGADVLVKPGVRQIVLTVPVTTPGEEASFEVEFKF